MEQKSLTLRECLIGDRTFYRHVAVVVLPIIVQNTLSNVVSLLDNDSPESIMFPYLPKWHPPYVGCRMDGESPPCMISPLKS